MKTHTGKLLLRSFLLLLLFAFALVIYQFIHQTHYFPVKVVEVYGARHENHQEVQNLVSPLVAHNFFAVDIELIKDRLHQFPWVDKVSIRRVWPDRVEVQVTEHQPLAIWHDHNLLSSKGQIFDARGYELPADLPKFLGPEGKQGEMLQFFNDINRSFEPLHAKIAYLELTPYQMWRLVLDNGVRVQIGHKNVLTRLGQFVKVYPKVIGVKAKDVDYVDLRYPSGMAIRWKNASEA